jgi:signal transduction histidine kinase
MPPDAPEPNLAPHLISDMVMADRNLLWGCGIAVATVGIAFAIDNVLRSVLLSHVSFIPLAAVAVTALCAGYGPSLLAAALSILGLYYVFWAPVDGPWNSLGVAVAFGPVVLIVAYGGGMVRSLYKTCARDAADLKAAVDDRNELLSLLSQDFRTHLSTLKLNHSVLRILMQSAAPKVDEDFTRRFELADREISRLTTLIDNVVEVSKSKAGRQLVNREEFDLSELAREIADSMSLQAEHAKCSLNIDLRSAVGKWDRFRLERVMLNLLANAIKYAPGRPIALRTYTADGRAKLVVEDHGPGIPENRLRTLFQLSDQPQHSSDGDDGLGLGLYVAKKIVEAHGGKIDAQSRVGEGSTFTVELPLWEI